MNALAVTALFVLAAVLAANRGLLRTIRKQRRGLDELRYEVGMYRLREIAEILLGQPVLVVDTARLGSELDEWIDEALS